MSNQEHSKNPSNVKVGTASQVPYKNREFQPISQKIDGKYSEASLTKKK